MEIKEIDKAKVAERLQNARKNRNLTMTEVSKLTNISTGNLSEIENAKQLPSATALYKLTQLYRVTSDYIFEGYNKVMHIDIESDILEMLNCLTLEEQGIFIGFLDLIVKNK